MQSLITLAIHKREKTAVLKSLLEREGILVQIEEISEKIDGSSLGFSIKIREEDLSRALMLIEATKLFSYSDEQTLKIDDGRSRILVAVDFSEYSMQACAAAFDVACEVNAKVKILHVFAHISYPSTLPFADTLIHPGEESLLDKARKNMLKLCSEIDKRISEGEFPSVNYSYSLREGLVEEEIENFIEEYKPTLLVLGTKGKDNNQIYMLGNVTADIIELTKVPVLAVPMSMPMQKLAKIKHLAFLTNIDKYDFAPIDSIVKFINPHNQVLVTLVHVNLNKKEDEDVEEGLKAMALHFQLRYPDLRIAYKLIETDDMIKGINDFIEKENVAMLSLNTRRRNLLGRLFIPSMSRKLLLKSNISLLVLRG